MSKLQHYRSTSCRDCLVFVIMHRLVTMIISFNMKLTFYTKYLNAVIFCEVARGHIIPFSKLNSDY